MKRLFPLLFLVCVIGAWAAVLYRNLGEPKKYEEYLEQAEAACEKEYYLETLQWLEKITVQMEPEQMYQAAQLKRTAYEGLGDGEAYIAQCLYMTEVYPEAEANYIYVLRYYQKEENLRALYHYLPLYREKWTENTELQELEKELNQSFQYVQTGYYDVRYASPSLVDIQALMPEKDGNTDKDSRKLCRSRGNQVFDYGYNRMQVSADGDSCFVCDEDGAWKLVDVNNHLLAGNAELSADSIGSLGDNDIATACKDGKYFFINRRMQRAEPEWEDAGTFANGVNAVCKDGKWALVTNDSWGNVTEYPYTAVARNSFDQCAAAGTCVAADERGYYLLDSESLELISENTYEELKAFESSQPTAYRKGDHWGFVNRYGEVYKEAVWEDAQPFVNGYAAVKMNGVWGYIDSQGDWVAEPQFHQALNVMEDGTAYVQNELGYWDYIIINKLYYADKE